MWKAYHIDKKLVEVLCVLWFEERQVLSLGLNVSRLSLPVPDPGSVRLHVEALGSLAHHGGGGGGHPAARGDDGDVSGRGLKDLVTRREHRVQLLVRQRTVPVVDLLLPSVQETTKSSLIERDFYDRFKVPKFDNWIMTSLL